MKASPGTGFFAGPGDVMSVADRRLRYSL